MVLNETPPPPNPADALPQAPPSDMVPILSPILRETKLESKLFAIVGSTIVAGPDFIYLVRQAEGDGLERRTYEMRDTLNKIAKGEATLADLRVFSEKYAAEHKYPSDPSDDLQSAAEAASFMAQAIGQ